jgi:hypothetical protein
MRIAGVKNAASTVPTQAWLFTDLPAYSDGKEMFHSAVILKEEDIDLHYRHVSTLQFLKLLSNLSTMS